MTNLEFGQDSVSIKKLDKIGFRIPKEGLLNTDKRLPELTQVKDYAQLINGLDQFQNRGDSIKYSWKTQLQREIVDSFYEEVIFLFENIYSDNGTSFTQNQYDLEVIKNKTEVIYISISKKKYLNHKGKTLIQRIDSIGLDDLRKNYFGFYEREFNVSEFFNNSIPFDLKTDWEVTPYWKAMNEAVISENLTFIIDGLKNGNTEYQLYALDALFMMMNKGYKMEENMEQLILKTWNRDADVLFRYGHVTRRKDIRIVMARLMKKHDIDYSLFGIE